jgi:hypothetical protein
VAGRFAQLVPRRFADLDAIMSGGLFDVREGLVALGIGHVADLVEAGDRVIGSFRCFGKA